MEHWFPLPGSRSKKLRMRYANAQPAAKVAITVGRGQPARGRGVVCAGCRPSASAASRRDGKSTAWPGAFARGTARRLVRPPTRSMAATADSGYRRRGSPGPASGSATLGRPGWKPTLRHWMLFWGWMDIALIAVLGAGYL